MDMQTMVDNAVAAMRNERLKNSLQWTVGEIIVALEGVENQSLPVYFDFDEARPSHLMSWRGAYCELAFEYTEDEKAHSVAHVLNELKESIGKTYEGYKGGDFVMGRRTPVWVAHYGDSGNRAIVGVKVSKKCITILTAECEY